MPIFGIGICPHCNRLRRGVESRRMNTAYVNDESNFTLSCEPCYDKTISYYAEMWDEYWSGRL